MYRIKIIKLVEIPNQLSKYLCKRVKGNFPQFSYCRYSILSYLKIWILNPCLSMYAIYYTRRMD